MLLLEAKVTEESMGVALAPPEEKLIVGVPVYPEPADVILMALTVKLLALKVPVGATAVLLPDALEKLVGAEV
jgi:hypothetical protein